MTETLKASLKLLLLLLWIAFWYLPVWIAKKLGKRPARDHMVRLCYAGILRIVGIRLKVTGKPAIMRPLLLVTNHLSYLDIPVIGSQGPIRFTPKSEIAKWPVVGSICRMCDAVFIDRRPEQVRDVGQSVQARLAEGDIVCLFPESTTGTGLHMQPFKSSFFSLAEQSVGGRELIVQPAAVVYTRIRRLPIDSTQWPHIAWYGDMDLLPHLFHLLSMGTIDAELVFLPPVTLGHYGDRKGLAAQCQKMIVEVIENKREIRS